MITLVEPSGRVERRFETFADFARWIRRRDPEAWADILDQCDPSDERPVIDTYREITDYTVEVDPSEVGADPREDEGWRMKTEDQMTKPNTVVHDLVEALIAVLIEATEYYNADHGSGAENTEWFEQAAKAIQEATGEDIRPQFQSEANGTAEKI